jgi:hypothetical protein
MARGDFIKIVLGIIAIIGIGSVIIASILGAIAALRTSLAKPKDQDQDH